MNTKDQLSKLESVYGELSKKFLEEYNDDVIRGNLFISDVSFARTSDNRPIFILSIVSRDGKEFTKYYDNELNTKYQKIADNILSFFVIETGNGGCNTLYFINTDGTVGQANVETFLANNDGTGEITINKNIKNLKNIVYITSAINNATASATSNPIFIDINGNMYK